MCARKCSSAVFLQFASCFFFYMVCAIVYLRVRTMFACACVFVFVIAGVYAYACTDESRNEGVQFYIEPEKTEDFLVFLEEVPAFFTKTFHFPFEKTKENLHIFGETDEFWLPQRRRNSRIFGERKRNFCSPRKRMLTHIWRLLTTLGREQSHQVSHQA